MTRDAKLSPFRGFLSAIMYPLILLGSLFAAAAVHSQGFDTGPTTGSILLTTGLLIWLLEYLMPYTDTWHPSKSQMGTDFLHSVFSSFLVALLMRATLLALFTEYGAKIAANFGSSFWPSHWNVAAQLVLALLIADLGAYTAHRMMHLTRVLWRIHAVHHSPEKMHFLAAGRTHPFNAIWTLTLENGPVLFLGISPEALMLLSVYKGVNGFLQHSNIDLRPGFLSYILATNEVHWWHHSAVNKEAQHNYGNTTMIWDQVFRSFYLPKEVRPRVEVGIDNAHLGNNYLKHLAVPFTLQSYETNADYR